MKDTFFFFFFFGGKRKDAFTQEAHNLGRWETVVLRPPELLVRRQKIESGVSVSSSNPLETRPEWSGRCHLHGFLLLSS